MDLNQFKEENGIKVEQQLPKSKLEENASKAGYQKIRSSENQREVDLVKDLGYKSPQQIAKENEPLDDITMALGPQLEEAAIRKKEEIKKFNEALEDNDFRMTEEDLSIHTEDDFIAMLSDVPDPLNKDLKQYTQQRLKEVKELREKEEDDKHASMEFTDSMLDAPRENIASFDKIKEQKQQKMNLEDEDLLNDLNTLDYEEETHYIEIKKESNNMNNNTNDIIPVFEEETVADVQEEVETEEEVQEERIEEENHVKNVISKLKKYSNSSDMDIDKELELLDKDSYSDDEEDKIYEQKIENVKKEIKDKVLSKANKLDIRGFTISTKPVTIDNSVNLANSESVAKSARWVLVGSKLPIEMTELKGTEIDELIRLSSSGRSSATELKKRYNIFYTHIISPKPDSVDDWLKTVSFMDIKHLYAAAYKATFQNTNFLPIDCTNNSCQHGFITDNVPFEKMVKYENDNAKEEIKKIYESTPNESTYKLYKSELIPISSTYAISFKEPSIYDAQIVPLYLDSSWYEKMESTVAIAAFIDKIYVIDAANSSLHPLNIKEYKDNITKTIKSKVLAIAKVLNTLSSDEYNLIAGYIEEINKVSTYVEYQLPEATCPKCQKVIEAREQSSANLLFTRHRLTSLVNG